MPLLIEPEDVLRILRAHVGRKRAISAASIVWRLRQPPGRYADRPIRAAIRKLRRDGHLILSATDNPRGYFIAANSDEWVRYAAGMRGRAIDLLKTVGAMDRAAATKFNAAEQLHLELAI